MQTLLPADGKLGPFGPNGVSVLISWFGRIVVVAWCMALLLVPLAPAAALNAANLPATAPSDHVLDEGDLLSRAAITEVSRALGGLAEQGVQADWISISRLDYGLSLPQLGQELLNRWQGSESARLLFLIDAQTSGTAVVADTELQQRLPAELLTSTARTTMAQPIREGARYRQASLDAIARIATVVAGGDDPGAPVVTTNPVATARVPSKEQTAASNAFTWVAVLLIVGSVVPMLTWWVFSR